MAPSNDKSRMFTIFMILFGLIFIFSILNDFANWLMSYAGKKASAMANLEDIDISDPYKFVKKRLYAVSTIAVFIMLGTVFFYFYENWSFAKSFYFCVVTTTTVG